MSPDVGQIPQQPLICSTHINIPIFRIGSHDEPQRTSHTKRTQYQFDELETRVVQLSECRCKPL
jgi:hypothetical protein